jgi:hypothetical protein
LVRRQAGLSEGDLVNFAYQRGNIIITPKIVTDGSTFPTADHEYSKADSRIIDARLKKADAGIRAGRMSNAFSNPAEFIAHLHNVAAKSASRKTKRAK